MKTPCHKLIRDRIPAILDAAGIRHETRVMADADFHAALRAKVLEEAREVADAAPGDLAKEIGDLLEVLDALMANAGLDAAAVHDLRTRRREERGGFGGRLELLWTEEAESAP